MRKLILTSVASIGLISLGACQSEQADQVEDQAEAQAVAIKEPVRELTEELAKAIKLNTSKKCRNRSPYKTTVVNKK